METFYSCKSCKEILTLDKQVVLKVITKNQEVIICYFNSEIGNYSYTTDPPTVFEKSELVAYHCPHCHEDLTSSRHPKFAEVDLLVNDDIKFDVLFSRDIGFSKTYVITEDFVEEYGDEDPPDFEKIFDIKNTK